MTLSDGTIRYGLTSKFLDVLASKIGTQTCSVRGFVKSSAFEMPASVETPLIMVGPGTGIVPFIGFMQEREQLLK